MTTLSQTRTDIATVVAASLGVQAFAGWRGQAAPNTARVVNRVGSTWIDMQSDIGTFGAVTVAFTVVCMTSGVDVQAAEDQLDIYASKLITGATKLGGQALANGGVCPPVATIDDSYRRIDTDSNLVGIEAHLVPISIYIT